MSRNPAEIPAAAPTPDDDIGPSYQLYRQDLAGRSAADAMAAAASSASPAPASPARPDETAASTGSLPGRIARDVGKGVVEAPLAAVKGIRDAFGNLFNMGDELAGWLEEKAADTPFEFATGGIKISGDGIEWLSPKRVREMRAAGQMTQTSSLSPLPAQQNPTTVTGGLVKSVSQFITGMLGASRVIGGAGYAMNTARGAASSFTAFDPHEARLSNLVEKFPALSNPVTRYLEAKPDDNAAEGRFKNAVEGMGFGLLTDGFVKSVKLLRSGLLARDSAKGGAGGADAAVRDALSKPAELADDAFTALGSEADNAALVKITQSPATLADATGAAAADAKPQTFINFARIDSPDDVKRVMQRLSDAGTVAPDSARAGARSFEQVKLDAAHQDAWQSLLARRPGQPLGDAESLAARNLWAATTDKVAELAEAAAKNPSEGNLFAFRKMLDVHDMVQREVLGARASTARALAQWRIPATAAGGAERLRAVQASLDNAGGSAVAQELAARVSALAKAGLVKEMATVAEKGAFARTRDAVVEAWINGLLSSPATHAANTISNTSVMFQRIAERGTAAQISRLLGTEGGVATGEATSQWFGMVQGMQDMLRYYGKLATVPMDDVAAVKSPLDGMNVPSLSKVEHPPSISSDALNLSSSSWLGRAADLGGELVRTPGKALGVEDEFFKTLGYRMELNAQALRQATAELGAGKLAEDGLKARIAELVANPPQNIRLAAADAALYQTFNNAPGAMAKSLMRLTSSYPALKVILPFVRTPANVLNYTFERTPLAPLMGRFRADVAAGGARRDLALAQTALGTSAMLAFSDLAMNGSISGRGPAETGQRQALQRSGWQPYSVKLGDRWYTYNRLDPVGSLIGMSADVTEMLAQAQHDALDDPDTEKLAVAAALAFAGNLTNKTYLSGLAGIVEALNDPTRAAEGWTQRTAGSVIPAAAAQLERVQDPTVREVYSMMDAIRARTPGLSDKLPPRLDLWGQPQTTQSGLGKPFDFISPVYSRPPNENPIDAELLRLGANITMPARRTSFDGVSVDMSQYPQAYSRYVELAGNSLKHPAWNMGARDFLNQVVTGKHAMSTVYQLRSDGPEGGKEMFIRDQINNYRELARRQLLEEFPRLRAEVDEKKRRQRELAMPALNAAR